MFRIAGYRLPPKLWNYRYLGSGIIASCSFIPGIIRWRRIWHQRHLYEWSCRWRAQRFLRIISVCDVDRRTTASPTGCRGFTTHHGRRCTQRVGMAYSFRVRSCVSCCGVVVTSSIRWNFATRNTRFKRSWISERIMAQSPCIHHGSRFYRCGLPLFLYLHHLYAEVSGKYCGNACQRGEWHYDCRIVCIHAYSTTHWRAVG